MSAERKSPRILWSVLAVSGALAAGCSAGHGAADHEAPDHEAADHEAAGAAVSPDEPEFESAAVRFAGGLFEGLNGDYGISFLPDGATIFFTRAVPGSGTESIFFVEAVEGGWGEPRVAPFSGEFHDKEPYVSPDGRRVYFASRRPVRGNTPRQDFEIWYVERRDSEWGTPVHVEELGSVFNDDYPAVAADGTVVFARNDDDGNTNLWIARAADGRLAAPEALPFPVNTAYAEADPWIAPDGGFIIFSSPQASPDAQGQGDFYVVYPDGPGWTRPASLGRHVNGVSHEYGPTMSPDGETFYFSRGFGGSVWMVPAHLLDNVGSGS